MATIELVVSDEATKRERAFIALALHADNAAAAATECGISASTLKNWRRDHRPEYERVRRELAPRLEAIAIAECQAVVLDAGRVERKLIAKLEEAIDADEIPKRDLPGALRNITTSKAINVDKILALSGRPTSVVEHRSAGELVRRLAQLGAVVDGSAVELPAAKPDDSA